jgi:anti-anti-sigma factor
MKLQIQTKPSEPTTLYLILDGKLDTLTAPELDSFISDKLIQNINTLIFDLQTLSYISSAGLRVFAKTRKLIKSRKGEMFFVNLSPQVEKVFEIVKAVPIAEVFKNTQELDAYLGKMQNQVIQEP